MAILQMSRRIFRECKGKNESVSLIKIVLKLAVKTIVAVLQMSRQIFCESKGKNDSVSLMKIVAKMAPFYAVLRDDLTKRSS